MNPHRLPFLDGLRLVAFGLLIPYHVGMYYVSWDWHVKSLQVVRGLEPFMLMSAPWRMGLLFLVGGAAAQGLFARRGLFGSWRDRSTRLLLPLLFGMALIVVPQAYFEVVTRVPEQLPGNGGYLDFWWAYLHGGRYCRGSDCMVVPTWNHLWFLPYLWAYSMVAALLAAGIAAVVTNPTQSRRVFAQKLPGWLWLLLPALPLVAARLWLLPRFGSTHAFAGDHYNHAIYAWLFALGWASRTPLAAPLWPQALRWRWWSLGLALLGWALLVAYFKAYAEQAPPSAVLWAQRVVWALMSWWALLAACGWGQRAFQRESPMLRAASAGVFCAYVLHQTVIILLTRALLPLGMPWALEALLLIGSTTLLCAAAYLALREVPGLRLLFGIQRPREAAPA